MRNHFSTKPFNFNKKQKSYSSNLYNQLYAQIVDHANDFVLKNRKLESLKNPDIKIKKLKKFNVDDAILIKQKIKRLSKKELKISVQALRSISNRVEKIFEGHLSYTFQSPNA